jgi:hypothetical protein
MLALSRTDSSELTDSVFNGLSRADAPHYGSIDPGELRQRCRRLVDAFLTSMAGAPAVFVEYVRGITDERIGEGYHLREIQLALSLLESTAWRLVVERSEAASLVPNLGIVTGTVGAAKDELARVYLEHKERAEAECARLQTSRLFAGTEGHVEAEAEAPAGRR